MIPPKNGRALLENGRLNGTFGWVTFCFRMCCPNTLVKFGQVFTSFGKYLGHSNSLWYITHGNNVGADGSPCMALE
jgi:hypothetical protein